MSIKEIAKITGYSISSVSRVLNNPDYKCSDTKMRDTILKVARERGYVANQFAKSLKTGKVQQNYHIGIIVAISKDIKCDPFYKEIQRIVEIEIHKRPCVISQIWENSIFCDEQKCKLMNVDKIVATMFNELPRKVDGVVVIGKCSFTASKVIRNYCKNVVSITSLTKSFEIDEIVYDGEKVGTLATEYLLKLGHKKIGYIGPTSNDARYNGYVKTLMNHSIDILPDYIFTTGLTSEDGYSAMEQLYRTDMIPTALYVSNDVIAIGVLKYLSIHKNIFYKPSIISSDDIDEAQYTSPMLTTIRLPKEEMSAYAIEILLNRIQGLHKSPLRVEFKGSLVVRESCHVIDYLNTCEYII